MSTAAAVETTSTNTTTTDVDDTEVCQLKFTYLIPLWDLELKWNLHHKLHEVFTIVVNHFFPDMETIHKIKINLCVVDVGDEDGDDLGTVQMVGDQTPRTCWNAVSGKTYTVMVIPVKEEEEKTSDIE